jgi:hypothetical protein
MIRKDSPGTHFPATLGEGVAENRLQCRESLCASIEVLLVQCSGGYHVNGIKHNDMYGSMMRNS